MMTNTRIAAFLAVAALSLIPAARASATHQDDRVEVYVVYESMPDEDERARTAALGARIVWESDSEPVRVLSIPASSLAAIQRGAGVLRVALEAERDLNAYAP